MSKRPFRENFRQTARLDSQCQALCRYSKVPTSVIRVTLKLFQKVALGPSTAHFHVSGIPETWKAGGVNRAESQVTGVPEIWVTLLK